MMKTVVMCKGTRMFSLSSIHNGQFTGTASLVNADFESNP